MMPAESQHTPGHALRLRDWAIAFLLAMAFKALYSAVGTLQLQWLLWPLATLLNAIDGFVFKPTATGEWLDADHGLIIVKACAGGNFLIASWLGYLWRWRTRTPGPVARLDSSSGSGLRFGLRLGPSLGLRLGISLALRALAAAWLTTLIANTLRILLIAHGQDDLSIITGLSAADSHRLIGIVVYFGILTLQLAGTRTLLAAPAIYFGIVVLVPWLHGLMAGRGGINASHAAWTTALPLVAVLSYGLWRLCHRYALEHKRQHQKADDDLPNGRH
jgi:hypothetical protein